MCWRVLLVSLLIALPVAAHAQRRRDIMPRPQPPSPPVAAAPVAPPQTSGGLSGLPFFPLRVRWTAELEAPPAAGVATDDVRVFVPLATGGLVAVVAESGTVAWRSDLETALLPVVDDGRVFVVAGEAIQALEAGTGKVVWRFPLPAAVSAPLVVRGGWVIGALASGEVVALRAVDGSEVWRKAMGPTVEATPAIDADRLYLPGVDGVVRALDVSTGEPRWSRALSGRILTIAPLGARIFVGSTDNYFYCLDERGGRVRWRWRAGADPVGAAIADDERVYFTSLDTVVRALDRGHGAQRWRQPLPWRPRTGPVRIGQTLVSAGIAVDLRGHALATGAAVGEFALTENRLEVLTGAPVVVRRAALPGDYLVAAIADGRLVALEHVFGLPARPLTDLPGTAVAITPPS